MAQTNINRNLYAPSTRRNSLEDASMESSDGHTHTGTGNQSQSLAHSNVAGVGVGIGSLKRNQGKNISYPTKLANIGRGNPLRISSPSPSTDPTVGHGQGDGTTDRAAYGYYGTGSRTNHLTSPPPLPLPAQSSIMRQDDTKLPLSLQHGGLRSLSSDSSLPTSEGSAYSDRDDDPIVIGGGRGRDRMGSRGTLPPPY